MYIKLAVSTCAVTIRMKQLDIHVFYGKADHVEPPLYNVVIYNNIILYI
jgi:hypothetical protein